MNSDIGTVYSSALHYGPGTVFGIPLRICGRLKYRPVYQVALMDADRVRGMNICIASAISSNASSLASNSSAVLLRSMTGCLKVLRASLL